MDCPQSGMMLQSLLEYYGNRTFMLSQIRSLYSVIFILGTLLASICLAGILFSPRVVGQAAQRHLFILGGLAALDLLLMCGLHWLRLSYGQIDFPWMTILTVRCSLLLLWVMAWFWTARSSTELGLAALRNSGWLHLGLQALITLLVIYAFYIEPFHLTVNTFSITSPRVKAGETLRLIQLSDLHVERLTRREIDLVRKVNELQPDVIVITGDFPNLSFISDDKTWAQITELVRQFDAPLGVFLVDGSVESPNQVIRLSQKSGTIALENQVRTIEWAGGTLALMGVEDETFHQAPVDDFNMVYRHMPEDAFKVVLFHTPDLAPEASAHGADLYLCGHTHGGQIRLPFYGAVVTSSVYHKRFEMGKYMLGNTFIYVNRGIGMEGKEAPRARFLAPPEIAVFDISGQ
jgi:predicted MPP superfamily phosphohydrolase